MNNRNVRPRSGQFSVDWVAVIATIVALGAFAYGGAQASSVESNVYPFLATD